MVLEEGRVWRHVVDDEVGKTCSACREAKCAVATEPDRSNASCTYEEDWLPWPLVLSLAHLGHHLQRLEEQGAA
jgi:hypothetical protein